jgi:hypothetical protein
MSGEYFCIEDPRDLDGEPEFCDVCHQPDAKCKCDPTPWCSGCGSMTRKGCDCGPIADNN